MTACRVVGSGCCAHATPADPVSATSVDRVNNPRQRIDPHVSENELPQGTATHIYHEYLWTARASDTPDDRVIYECSTVITTFPFLCPCSTYLKASTICSKG